MKLADLHPVFLGHGGDGITQHGQPVPVRDGVGLRFDCPHGAACPQKVGKEFPHMTGQHAILFENPLDGGPALPGTTWIRTGDTFDTLTLTPSVLNRGCGWHGWIRNGEVIEA